MRSVRIEPSFSKWREKARELLAGMVEPGQVMWGTSELYQGEDEDGGGQGGLLDFGDGEESKNDIASNGSELLKVPRQFVRLAETVSSHRSGKQWAMLYEVLWKMTYGNDRAILQNQTDVTMRALDRMRAAVSRDIHKMRAFVRFRKVDVSDDEEEGREQFVSWFEPDHRIVRLNAPFFRKRFGGMNFSILTPDECMHWNGVEVSFTEGVSKNIVPDEDELETLWKGYYRSIFNPARVKIKMMQSEMPKKYWKNLPEAEIIEELIRDSSDRVHGMMEEENRELKPRPKNKYLDYLDELNGLDDETE
ncbi:MAG: TIGR03915 family putative DNA repair protein [Akkermansiaceae bacterium]